MTTSTCSTQTSWLLVDDYRNYAVDAVARDFRSGARELKTTRYDGLMIDYQLSTMGMEPTGLNLLEWAVLRKCLPPRIYIVSTHPDGVKRIEEFLRSHGYVQKDTPLEIGEYTLTGYWEKEESAS